MCVVLCACVCVCVCMLCVGFRRQGKEERTAAGREEWCSLWSSLSGQSALLPVSHGFVTPLAFLSCIMQTADWTLLKNSLSNACSDSEEEGGGGAARGPVRAGARPNIFQKRMRQQLVS